MKRKMLWFAALALVIAAGYTLWEARAGGAYSPQELSEEQAVAVATRFLRDCGFTPPSRPARVSSFNADRLRSWHVLWDGEYDVGVEARTGLVYWFSNDARIYHQVKRIGRDRAPQIASREAAEQYCWQVARRLGLPKDAYLEELRLKAEGEGGDANRSGAVVASFNVRYFGYTFLDDEGCDFSFTVDPIDGTLVYFSRRAYPFEIESHDVRLSKSEAVQKAKQVYEGWYRTRRSPHRGQYTGRVEVGYVFPNSNFGRKASPPQVPYRARLAYAVYFGEEAVWIDAANGSLLGGRLLK